MYSFPNLEPVCYSMSNSNCCFLTSIQISQEAGQVVWYSHLLKNFPQFVMIHSTKYSLDMSNFLEEISSLSHSIVFLYFFELITGKGFLISPCYSLEHSVFKWVYLSFSPLIFTSFFFTAICKASSASHFAFCISFSWGWSWSLSPVQCHKPPSIVHQAICLSDLVP